MHVVHSTFVERTFRVHDRRKVHPYLAACIVVPLAAEHLGQSADVSFISIVQRPVKIYNVIHLA